MTARTARVVDVETTGFPDDENAELLEVGFVDVDLTQADFPVLESSAWQSLLKPNRPIPPVTMAVHHITDEDVAEAPSRLVAYKALGDGLSEDDVYVAHNATFEQHFYSNRPQAWICTLKCAYRAWPEAPGHSNQVLRYWHGLGLNPALAMPPHRALPDAYVTAHILRKLLLVCPIHRLIEISGQPALLPRINFGKYRGKTFKEVLEVDRGYLIWLADKSEMGLDAKYTARHHLGEEVMLDLPKHDSERQKLVGKRVEFTVVYDGVPERRTGTITRIGPQAIFVGAYCYHQDQLHALREIGSTVDG